MHRAIQTVINEVWFHNRNADGVKLQEEFCKPAVGISPFLIALVCTAIECCLEEWETGDRSSIHFTAALYNDKYLAHTALINELAERNQDAVKRLCIKIMKRALKRAGVNPNATGEVRIDEEALDAATQELANLSDED